MLFWKINILRMTVLTGTSLTRMSKGKKEGKKRSKPNRIGQWILQNKKPVLQNRRICFAKSKNQSLDNFSKSHKFF